MNEIVFAQSPPRRSRGLDPPYMSTEHPTVPYNVKHALVPRMVVGSGWCSKGKRFETLLVYVILLETFEEILYYTEDTRRALMGAKKSRPMKIVIEAPWNVSHRIRAIFVRE